MTNPLLHQLNVMGSLATSTLALWRGTFVIKAARQPKKPLKLYDMEGSPYCRCVREALTALGLDAEIYPCPQHGKRFRPWVGEHGGKRQFPYFVDANTDTSLYESADIIDYLFKTYGGMATPAGYRNSALMRGVTALGSVTRGLRGIKANKSKPPAKLLELWSFESSPYSRLVRERLTELELPYVLHNIGKEQFADLGPAVMRVKPGPYNPKAGGRRAKLLAELGRVQVPYLVDPNTGTKLFESATIIDYLNTRYGV